VAFKCQFSAPEGSNRAGRHINADATFSAGNLHAAFDERGGETERCRMAQATAPLLDSTVMRDFLLVASVVLLANASSPRFAQAQRANAASDAHDARTDH
jgi:hypothetical protein